jgi:hypothetical protein
MDDALSHVLRSALAFRDGLRDVGIKASPVVRLSRQGGLKLLSIVTGCESPMLEYLARDRLARVDGCNRINISGVSFEWPEKAPETRAGNAAPSTAPPARNALQ